ncbi:MAG: tetratricopeptide repeat protein [Thermoanaerobaculia bacterium]|nr:MAG: tetratricopeptide repeat protein [Thermoanaerobaculia bacterium]
MSPPGAASSSSSSATATLKTLVVTDLVDSTLLVGRLGDARAAELSARHDRLARALLERHEGREIDKTDGFLLLFERPIHAVAFALGYHEALARLAADEGVALDARAAVHVGEVFLRENPPEEIAKGAKPVEVEGLAKPIAARLMALARGGQTLLTRSAFDLARRAAAGVEGFGESLRWLAHGTWQLKGVDEPVEVFEVGVEGRAPLLPPSASEKARRVGSGDTVLGWRPAPGLPVPMRPNWAFERKIGEGGFGEVWLARHRKTHEPRVLKFCFDLERARALQREVTVCRLLREALGNRPDIARILDWNFEEPPYFLEFEYTEGGNLSEWVEARGGFGAVPLPTRLELAAQVAEAVAAAHSVGVLHKDIKPGNVLVTADPDGRPRARVTDFGIGLITEHGRLADLGITVLGMTEPERATGSSHASGTRIYMAPEVLEGKPATTQADIYSLGVLVYQLVVGDFTRALASGWERDVADEILREDVAAFVDGRPERRVASAGEVAQRLRGVEERRAQRRAERVASNRVTEFLVDLFQVSDPSEARGNSITAREVLDRGAARIDEDLAGQPLVQAKLMDAIGTVYVQLGLLEPGGKLLEQAWRLRRDALGPGDLETANSVADLAWLAEKRGDYAEAEKRQREALELRSAAGLGEDEPSAKLLTDLAWTLVEQARFAEAHDLLERALLLRERHSGPESDDVADTLTTLAYVHFKLGQYREAVGILRRVVAIHTSVHGPDSTQVASAKNNLAVQLREIGETEEALRNYGEALAIQEKALGPDHPDLGSLYNNIAHIHQDRGELAQSEAWFRRSLAVREKALGERHPLTAITLNNLGYCLWLAGEVDEAGRLWRRALAVREAIHGPDHPEVAVTLSNLALLALSRGELEESDRNFTRALAIAGKAFGGDQPATLGILEGYAALLDHERRHAESAAVRARVKTVRDAAAGRGERLPAPPLVRLPA